MTSDLDQQLRALVDAARPVSAEEAVARARTLPSPFEVGTPERPRWPARSVAAAAAVLALVAGGIAGVLATQSTGRSTAPAPAARGPRRGTVLSASAVRTIAAASMSVASSGGTAAITEWDEENGVPSGGYEASVTFSGSNIDERVTSVPQPPGSAGAFAIDDRLVDGQFYTYTVGDSGVPEWLHYTNPAGHHLSMAFPDPRTLYSYLTASARFQYEGKNTLNGASLSRLTALDPFAIKGPILSGLADRGHITSFTLWVGPNDVVQEVAFTISAQIPFTTASIRGWNLGTVATITTTSSVTVVFSQLGMPQNVVAPATARDAG
jgi:hypothetical protein